MDLLNSKSKHRKQYYRRKRAFSPGLAVFGFIKEHCLGRGGQEGGETERRVCVFLPACSETKLTWGWTHNNGWIFLVWHLPQAIHQLSRTNQLVKIQRKIFTGRITNHSFTRSKRGLISVLNRFASWYVLEFFITIPMNLLLLTKDIHIYIEYFTYWIFILNIFFFTNIQSQVNQFFQVRTCPVKIHNIMVLAYF